MLDLAVLLAEKAARDRARSEPVRATTERYRACALTIRERFHAKQLGAALSEALRKLLLTTRRAGKSTLLLGESFAQALERRSRWMYCHATRAEAERIAWRGDMGDGWRDLCDKHELKVASRRNDYENDPSFDCIVNEADLTIEFRNGSQLAIFCADRAADADKLRGGEKDGIIVDEAQQFPDLDYFVDEVATPMLAKPFGSRQGVLILAGTPHRNLSGLFYEASKPTDHGPRKVGEDGLPVWEVHEFTVSDNPYYAAVRKHDGKYDVYSYESKTVLAGPFDTREEAEEAAKPLRWQATAGAELQRRGWDINNPPPQFIREWLGQWTKGDALYVYAVHAAKPVEFAAVRVDKESGRYDHANAMRDLPQHVVAAAGWSEPIEWYFTLGVDFGFDPDPFAWVLWAWSPMIVEVYEMGSWKKTRLFPDAMRSHLMNIWAQVQDRLWSIRADAGGAMASAMIEEWEEVIKLPLCAAEKHAKQTYIELYNGELHAQRLRYRTGSALLTEQRNLQWRVMPSGKRVENADRVVDSVVHGNHCSDAGLYGWRDVMGRQTEFALPQLTSEEKDQQLLDELRNRRIEKRRQEWRGAQRNRTAERNQR